MTQPLAAFKHNIQTAHENNQAIRLSLRNGEIYHGPVTDINQVTVTLKHPIEEYETIIAMGEIATFRAYTAKGAQA